MVKKHKGGRRQILQLDDKKQQTRNEWEPTSTATLNKEASPLDSQVADFFKEIDALTVNEKVDEGNSEATCSNSDVASCSNSDVASCSYSGVASCSNSGVASCSNSGVASCANSGVPSYSNSGVPSCSNSGVPSCSNSGVASCSNSGVASCSKQKDPDDDSRSEDGLPEKSEGSNSQEVPNDAQNDLEGLDTSRYWQEIPDETTGYNYYWNTVTNQVTWDCPSEYIIFLKSLQTAQFGPLPQPQQSSSNESPKKLKKKREPPHPPEGSIIPISYFGESSSEESSDEEKENSLDTTSKCRKADAKYLKGGMQKNKDMSLSDKKGESQVETMGPHLPHDNNVSKHVSSASRTSYLSKEAEISTKNEVEEYFEIGPQLPSNSLIDLSKNSECNTVSDSSSKCASVSHSYTNGPTVASTTFEEPWEVSLMNIDRKFRGLDQDIGEESPDSTVRKGDNLPENNVPCQTSNDTCGIRGVVEYDNFTDDEEEMSSSNISSSKQETFFTHKSKSGYKKARQHENVQDNLRQFRCNKSEVTQSETQRILPKRKYFGEVDECEDLSFKKSKQKEKVDLDSLFTNHSNNSKYGFGFSRQDQLNLESDFFCSTSSHHEIGTSNGPNDYKAISFVKSDHVFDLSTVNKKVLSGGNSSSSESCRNLSEQDFDSESIYRPGPSGLNGIKDLNSRNNASNKPSSVQNEESVVKEKSNLEDIVKSPQHCNTKTSSLSEKRHSSGQKDVSSSRTNGHYRRENAEDLDRALCKAVQAKAKKSEGIAPKPSSSSSVSSNQKCKRDSSVTKKINAECAKSVAKSGSLSDDIVNLSSILIDKLTFLISNHSTLTSLSSLLIQIQTRLIDWQAGSLESKYFMSRLQEVQQYLQHYEVGAVSGDWTCQWDRENKRYFYLNSRTQQSQWTYPDELCGKENSWMPSSTDMASTSASSEVSVERDELQTVSSSVPEGQLNKSSIFTAESSKEISDKYSDSSAMWLSESSPPPPPPGVDSPPPPPPHSPPPDSPPPPPPDSTEVEDILEDMDIENSDDSNPTLIVTNSRADTPSDNHMQFSKFAIPSPERSSENFTNASLTNAVSSTSLSGFEDMNIVSKSPQLVSTSQDTFENADSVNMHWSMSQPSCSTDIVCNFDSESEAIELSDQKSLPSDKDSEMTASSSSRSYVCSNEITTYRKPSSPYPSTSSSTTSRKEKKKTKLSSGLALKKKNIPSLVEKWQKIKEQQDKEDKNPDDPRNSNSF